MSTSAEIFRKGAYRETPANTAGKGGRYANLAKATLVHIDKITVVGRLAG